MPLIDPPDDYAKPPRLPAPAGVAAWSDALDVRDGYAVLQNAAIEGAIELGDCRELELVDCQLTGVSFADQPGLELEIVRSSLTTCDLSQTRTTKLARSRFAGCKFIGTDLSGSAIGDVIFHDCTFRYANVRMSTLRRVAFENSRLNETDFYDSSLSDVAFDRSELSAVTLDKCRLEGVDVRHTTQLGLTGVGDLRGALITTAQVAELAPLFALASGVDIANDG